MTISVLLSLSLMCLLQKVFSYPTGIQYETSPLDSSTYKGCKACYTRHYKFPTNSTDVQKCMGPYLFVGAGVFVDRKLSIILGAFELASTVKTITAINTPLLSNGVYWYFTPGKSFGFLNNTDLMQNNGDAGTSDPASRLSWRLDSNVGGYRAGAIINPQDKQMIFKIIFNCPSPSSSSPTAPPSSKSLPKPNASSSKNTIPKPNVSPSSKSTSKPSVPPSFRNMARPTTRQPKSRKPSKKPTKPRTRAPKPSPRNSQRAPLARYTFPPV